MMPISFANAFGIHEQALQLRHKRTELLALNLANADTPGYKARDIDFAAALKQAQAGIDTQTNRKTHARHISGFNESGIKGAELMYRKPLQPSLDGNTVDSHLEKAKFTENAIQYQATLTFLDGKIKSLMQAIRGE